MAELATGLIIFAVGLIYLGWTRRKQRHIFLLSGGWAALTAGLSLWGAHFEDSGVAIGGAVAVLTAFVILSVSAVRSARDPQPGRIRNQQLVDTRRRSPNSPRVTIAFAVSAVLVSGIIALALGIATTRLVLVTGGGEANAIVAAYVLVPILWAVIASYGLLARSGKQKTLVLAALALTPAAFVTFTG